MGRARWQEFDPVTPTGFTANGTFSAELPVTHGVIKGYGFKIRFTTVGSTAVFQDAPERVVSHVRVSFPRIGLRAYESEGPLRYLRLVGEYLNHYAPRRNATGAATDQYSTVRVPFEPAHVQSEHLFGIDARELSGPVKIEGRYGALADYGTGTTALNGFELIPMLLIDDEAVAAPRAVLLPVHTRIPFNQNTKQSNIRLERANLDGLFAVLLFTEDSSVPAADRINGLVTDVKLSHLGVSIAEGEFFSLQEEGFRYFNIDPDQRDAAVPAGLAGTCALIANRELAVASYPDLMSADLVLMLDPVRAPAIPVTNVDPAAGDQVHAMVLGIQGNAAFLEALALLGKAA